MRMVSVLDGLVLFSFRDKPELIGAWVSARNVAWPAAEPAKPRAEPKDEARPAA